MTIRRYECGSRTSLGTLRVSGVKKRIVIVLQRLKEMRTGPGTSIRNVWLGNSL